MFLLLYADDTFLLSESSNDLQNMLSSFADYCDTWQLKINVSKTKVLVFSRGAIAKNLKFFLRNKELEIVKNYKYLGIFFARSGSFVTTRSYLCEQAIMAMYMYGSLKKM